MQMPLLVKVWSCSRLEQKTLQTTKQLVREDHLYRLGKLAYDVFIVFRVMPTVRCIQNASQRFQHVFECLQTGICLDAAWPPRMLGNLLSKWRRSGKGTTTRGGRLELTKNDIEMF